MKSTALLLAGLGAFAQAAPTELQHFGRAHGFGASRLKEHQQAFGWGHLGAPNACPGVDELYFTDAVVDNFASIGVQQKWAAPGQRYWTR